MTVVNSQPAGRQAVGLVVPLVLCVLLLAALGAARHWNRGPAWVDVGRGRLLPGLAVLELSADAACTIPNVPGRWVGRSMGCRLTRGTLRIATGPAFRGGILAVEAPGFAAVTSGARFEVAAEGDSAWIGVARGAVQFMPKRGAPRTVAAGQKLTVLPAGVLRERPLLAHEARALEELGGGTAGPGF